MEHLLTVLFTLRSSIYSPSPEYPAACRSEAKIPPSEAEGIKGEVNHTEALETFEKRPFLLNFCVPDGRDLRFAATSSNFNPRNTQCIRARPVKCEAYFSGVVKIIAFLERKQKLTFFKGLLIRTKRGKFRYILPTLERLRRNSALISRSLLEWNGNPARRGCRKLHCWFFLTIQFITGRN